MSDAARSSGGNLKDRYDGAPKLGVGLPLFVESESVTTKSKQPYWSSDALTLTTLPQSKDVFPLITSSGLNPDQTDSRDVLLPKVRIAASKVDTFKQLHIGIPRFSNSIRHSGEALKEPSKNLEEHCTSLQCSSDLLIGLREIGAEWCRSDLIDFQLLVKDIQIGGCVYVSFQTSCKALSSELLAGLQLVLITPEGSGNAHPLRINGSYFYVEFLKNCLGESQPFFGRIKEEYQKCFLSAQYLHFMFHCHRGTASDRSISSMILLEFCDSLLLSDRSAKHMEYELILSSTPKMSHSFSCLRTPYSFNERKFVICNISYVTLWLSALTPLVKLPPHIHLISDGASHYSPLVEKVDFIFLENFWISSVFVFAENKFVFVTLPGIDKSGLNRLCSFSQRVYENEKETSCERSLPDPYKSISTVGGFERYSGKTCTLLAKSKPSYSGWIMETSDSIVPASCRKQGSDSKGIPAVDVLQEENEKNEVFHLISNLRDGIHTNEDVSLCFPLYSCNQIRSPSQSDKALDSDAVFSLANDSHNTDTSNGNDLPRIQTLSTESVRSVDELNECGSNRQRDQNEFESCLYIDGEQVTENASSSNSTLFCAKLPERLLLDESYLPNREEGSTTHEYSFSFVENKDDQRDNFSSIIEESEKEKLNLAVDPICDSQDIFERDSEPSLGSDREIQCNAWLGDLVGHQNPVPDCSDACRQSIAGPSPVRSSKKTDTGTQTEDCFGPVLANFGNELAASQNMCHKLQQKIKCLEKQLELFKEEKQKLQADLGRYLFLDKKKKRMLQMSVKGHDLLGHIVSGRVTTDYDGSCSSDSAVSVMNEASDHSHGKSLSGRKTELQEHAADSTPDQSVPTQDRSLDWQANRQNRNGLLANGTSLPSSSNADLLPENDTIFSGEKAGPEQKQHSLLPCTQRSEKTTDDVPVSSMNEECNLQSFEGAVIANDYPWTFKSFDDCVSSNSIASATNIKISCDSGLNSTCNEEKPMPLVRQDVDWKDENVELPGSCAANGEERVERAVDSVGKAAVTTLPPDTNPCAVSTVDRQASCGTDWERLGARPKQTQHPSVAERPSDPLVSAADGLAANFLARHTQDKALQDSLTSSPVFSENFHGTSHVEGCAPEVNRATTYFGGLSFTSETDPHRRIEKPLLSTSRGEFDRRCIEGDYSYEHLYNNTSDAPDGTFDGNLGDGNVSRFSDFSSRSTTTDVTNSHALQSGFVQTRQMRTSNYPPENMQNQPVLPDSWSAFNSESTNTTQQHCSTPGFSVVPPSGCTTTFEGACLAHRFSHDTSILQPRHEDADRYRDFGTDSVESSDNSLLALERRVAEASALVEKVLREREEREQFGREIKRKEQLIREQRAKEKREREERELREAENWPQQQEAINARSQWLCEHYQRHCRVRFPCCTQFYPCHRCHNISKACDNEEAKACHATHLKCSHCQEEQEIGEDSANCRKCGRKMSAYFCAICKHFTSVDKNPYHCDKCGICRIHQDKSFHCEVCNVCLDKRLEGNHKCRPDSGHDECCICLEDAFSGCQILPCSHKVHRECAIAMIQNGIRTCPICRHPLYSQPRE